MDKPKGLDELNEREEQREYLRGKLQEYVESITTKDPVKKHFYKCPFCGNEEHVHSTSGAFSIAGDKKHWKCFSCGNKSGDIFDLIGYQYGYKSGSSDKKKLAAEYKKEFDKACEIFKLDTDFQPPKDKGEDQDTNKGKDLLGVEPLTDAEPISEDAAEVPEESKADYKDYLTRCHAECTEESRGFAYLTGRGFTPETIDRFILGYDKALDVITIPYDKSCHYYITRTIEGKNHDKPSTEEAGQEPVFNKGVIFGKDIIFVCESPLDAISIMQSGGTAVALGGTGIAKLLKECEEKKPSHCLVLNFDNDKAGKDGQREASERLKEKGIVFIEASYHWELYGDPQKDSNDLLKSNADQLRKDVEANKNAAKTCELESGNWLYSVGAYKDLFKDHRTTDKQRISTGFNSLDIALYGGFANELYILSAETSIGKSAIACCLAQNIAASGIDVLYYALEMGRDEFIARGVSMISKENNNPIPYAEILNYRYDEATQEFYRRSYDTYETYVDEYMRRYGEHLYFIEGGFYGKTALSIADRVESIKKKNNLSQLVIVVDYLQRLTADASDKTQRDLMSVTSNAVQVLGNLATQKHNTVIAISSISNAQMGQKVTTAAGKYSGDIAYTGGVLLGWNWHGYTDTNKEEEKEETKRLCKERGYREMILEVLKQRSGERDKKVTMFYYPAYNYFTSPSTEGKIKPHKGKRG